MRTRWGISRAQLILVMLVVALLMVIAYWQAQPDVVQPYDPTDTGSSGLRALVLWLEEMGYDVSINRFTDTPSVDADLYWVHAGDESFTTLYSAVNLATLYHWVEAGGTLVLVGPSASYARLSERFGVEQIEPIAGFVAGIHQVQPLLPDVAGDWEAFYAPRALKIEAGRAIVPVLSQSTGAPVVALQHIGAGVVWHLTDDFALTNLHLRDDRLASLLPAILRTVPNRGSVEFSTHHLSNFDYFDEALGEVSTLQDWLYTTPFGQATLLVLAALLLYLVLQGRRLGPALPAPSANRAREAAEYVLAMAGLQRRMRQPQMVAAHHRQRLKSAVGRLAQAPAGLPDREWLGMVQRSGALTPETLNATSELLAGYAGIGANPRDEHELIELIQATDALLSELPRAHMKLVR